jgi:spermidine/putrescine transport system substrate-binding protein
VPADIGAIDNPYDALWDTKYAGDLAILDDWHTAMSMVLLRNGIHDINSTSSTDLAMVRKQILELRSTMRPKVTISMYTDMPAGQYGLAQFWSGDAINMPYYLPKNVSPDVLRYWFPSDGKGEVDNDLVVCLAQGQNPVAAHFFMNALLDNDIAKQNFGYTGYQPPLKKFTPDSLVAQGYVPKNLASAVVREEDFKIGFPLLQLPPDSDTAWHQVWQEFKAGG